jgi:hypothetical protein
LRVQGSYPPSRHEVQEDMEDPAKWAAQSQVQLRVQGSYCILLAGTRYRRTWRTQPSGQHRARYSSGYRVHIILADSRPYFSLLFIE